MARESTGDYTETQPVCPVPVPSSTLIPIDHVLWVEAASGGTGAGGSFKSKGSVPRPCQPQGVTDTKRNERTAAAEEAQCSQALDSLRHTPQSTKLPVAARPKLQTGWNCKGLQAKNTLPVLSGNPRGGLVKGDGVLHSDVLLLSLRDAENPPSTMQRTNRTRNSLRPLQVQLWLSAKTALPSPRKPAARPLPGGPPESDPTYPQTRCWHPTCLPGSDPEVASLEDRWGSGRDP